MNAFARFVDELEEFARKHRGCFLLPNASSRQIPPDGLRVICHFEVATIDAETFVRSVAVKYGLECLVTNSAAVMDTVFQSVALNSLALFGSASDEYGDWIGAAEHFRNRYPFLIKSQIELRCKLGWVRILERYFDEVTEIANTATGFKLLHVRNTFGMLEIGWRSGLPSDHSNERQLTDAATLALYRSLRTCEVCGLPGSRVREDRGRVFTSCELHTVGAKPVLGGSGPAFLSGLSCGYDPTTDSLTER